MFGYILKRILYAIPILIGVNLITFMLFFMVNSPDDMARAQLGAKQVTPQMIESWKVDKGYDKPLFINDKASGIEKVTDTLFVQESLKLFFLILAILMPIETSVQRSKSVWDLAFRLLYRRL